MKSSSGHNAMTSQGGTQGSRSRSEDDLSDTDSTSGSADSVIYNGRRSVAGRRGDAGKGVGAGGSREELRRSLDRLKGGLMNCKNMSFLSYKSKKFK